MNLIKRMDDGLFLQPRTSLLLNRLFEDSIQHVRQQGLAIPPVDIVEDEKQFEVHVALPGFKKENIQVEFSRNQLSIVGERQELKTDDSIKLHRVESFQGKFQRTFNIPDNVDRSQINARYQDGILTVVIPKHAESNLKTNIPVQ
jgi:HSP20 family protein